MSLETNKKIPSIKWYQSDDEIYFSILIHNFNKNNIKINKNNFFLESSNYKINFDFYQEIDEEDIKYKEFEKYLNITLKKINEGPWKYLVKDNLYKNNVKVDWDKWYDEDMEDDESEMDFGNMMGGMPGMGDMMGGMPDMGDMMGEMPDMEELEDNDDNNELNDDNNELNDDNNELNEELNEIEK